MEKKVNGEKTLAKWLPILKKIDNISSQPIFIQQEISILLEKYSIRFYESKDELESNRTNFCIIFLKIISKNIKDVKVILRREKNIYYDFLINYEANINNMNTDQKKLMTEYGIDYLRSFEEAYINNFNINKIYPESSTYTKTQFSELNKYLDGGFIDGTTTLISGKSNQGKTTWLCNLAIQWLKEGKKIVYITNEYNIDDLSKRFREVSKQEKENLVFCFDSSLVDYAIGEVDAYFLDMPDLLELNHFYPLGSIFITQHEGMLKNNDFVNEVDYHLSVENVTNLSILKKPILPQIFNFKFNPETLSVHQ